MTPEQIELSKRAVACKGWRWMPGMLGWRPDNHGVPHSIRFVKGVESMEALAGVGTGPLVASGYATCDGYWRSDDVTPDLTDPATLGCVLALVRAAWEPYRGENYICSTLNAPSGWGVVAQFGSEGLTTIVLPICATEAEALVAALEAAHARV